MNIQQFFKRLRKDKPREPATSDRAALSATQIPSHVLQVVEKLTQAGYQAYLVGGCVRDLLTGTTPKDFDVATNAKPHDIRRLFNHSRLIGRRFLLVHVFFRQNNIVEVATFRGNPTTQTQHRMLSQDGQILQDNVFGTIEEDALRRDFTINALFYNPHQNRIVDYTHGLTDIDHHTIRLIGDPETRYREDPIRMLRALRFAAKLGFTIEPATEKPLHHMGTLLHAVSPTRLFEETMKLFTHGYAVAVLKQLRAYGFEKLLLAGTEHYNEKDWSFIQSGLQATDERYYAHKTCSIAFLLALFFYPAYRERLDALSIEKRVNYPLREEAIADTLRSAMQVLTIPKRFSYVVRSIWHLQHALITAKPTKVERLVEHSEFRPAFDLLWLRANTHEPELLEWATWWKTHYGHAAPIEHTPKKRNPRHRGPRRVTNQ